MRSKMLPALLAMALLGTSGCASSPQYERPALPVPAVYPAAQAGGQDGEHRLQAADIGWRDQFAEPRLHRIIELALHNNRDLRTAVLRVAQAQAEYRIQRAALSPAVTGATSMQRTRTPRDQSISGETISHAYAVNVGASWELDLFGKIRSTNQQALAQYFATAEARRASEIALVAQVAVQYLTLRSDDEEIALIQASLEVARRSAQIAQVRFAGGTGGELDLREAQGVVEQREADLAGRMRARARAENALTLLIGAPLPADLPAPAAFELPRLVADVTAGLPSDLLERRPDIMQAEQELHAANYSIGAARAAFFPSITLTGQLGTQSLALGNLFEAGQRAWSIAPRITLPILDGGRNKANLDSARIKHEIAIANYEKAVQTAFREVADGLVSRGTYVEQIDKLQQYVLSQERRLELAQMRHERGVDTYLSVLSAQNALYTARQSLIAARLERWTNLVDLYRALGGGWIADTGAAPRLATSTLAP